MRAIPRTLFSSFRRERTTWVVKIINLLKMPLRILLVTPVALYFVTGSGGLSACAADVQLTPAETRSLIGDTIPAKYFNGSDYVDFTFRYSSTWSISSVSCASPCLPTSGQTVLIYDQDGSFNISGNNSYIQVDLRPEYSFFDTNVIKQFIGVSSGSYVSFSAYQSPAWRWYMSFQGDKSFYNDSESFAGSGYQSYFTVGFDSSMPFTFVDADYTAQNTFSAYSYRALFYGNSAKNGHIYLAVSCPIVSDSSSMASGTGGVTTGTSGGGSGDVNVSVIVDNSDVVSALSGLGSYPAETATTVATLPPDLDIEGALTGANDILDELPDVVESTGFWLYFLGRVFGITFATVPVFQSFALVLVLLSIFMYILWRK